MLNDIETLCKEYTDLDDYEIGEIKCAAKSLSAMANLFGADAFIDCPMCDGTGDAIVVAEAKPVDAESSYKRTVVGLVATKEKEPAVYRGFHLGVSTKFMKAVTQENSHVVQTVEPIYFKDRVIGVFIIEQHMEKISSGSEADDEKLAVKADIDEILIEGDTQNVVDTIEEGLLFIDHELRVIFCNKAAEDIYARLGFLNNVTGADYKDICIVAAPGNMNANKVTIQEVKLGDYYFTVKTVNVDREDIKYVVNISDITTRKNQEKELVLKSFAFSEMHHRVKNNLQTIAALLRLQRNNIESEEGRQALNDTISRILAIASTHQILVETEVEDVRVNDIVASVKDNAILYYMNDDFHLDIECYGGDFSIKFEKATAIALILNELIQNSIKYAFKGRDRGRIILITMNRRADDIELVFIDDGCGFDVGDTFKEGEGMGWTIIRSMVKEKLGGHIMVKSDSRGTKVKIVF